jgi:predicted DNA-binding transcriptional regulator AlpA
MTTLAKTEATTARARTKAVLDYFDISAMTLWRWQKQANFPSPLRRGQIILFDIAAIEQWLSGEVQP